jgi:hypothetical protein
VLFFGPIYSLINLFIYILHNPKSPQIQSDLALMDVGSGFFARLRFSTDGKISIVLANEMALLATRYLNESRQSTVQGSALNSQPHHTPNRSKEQISARPPMPDLQTSLDLETVSVLAGRAFILGFRPTTRSCPEITRAA